jgi:hypothetical protein
MDHIEYALSLTNRILDCAELARDDIATGTLSRDDAIDCACADVADAMQYLYGGIDYAPYAALTRQRIINLISVE